MVLVVALLLASGAAAAPRFSVTYPAEMSAEPLTGRLLLVVAPGGKGEPRLQVTWDEDAIPFFGIDVETGRRASGT